MAIYRYQQILPSGICIGYSDGPGEITAVNMILSGEDDNYIGWRWSGAAWVDPPAPPAASPSLTPVIYAVGNFAVADADITGIDTAVNFSAAMWLDVGTYLVLFSETQPNTQYLAKAYSGTSQALVVEKGEDYLIINASNTVGPYDPAEFSLEVIRVQ